MKQIYFRDRTERILLNSAIFGTERIGFDRLDYFQGGREWNREPETANRRNRNRRNRCTPANRLEPKPFGTGTVRNRNRTNRNRANRNCTNRNRTNHTLDTNRANRNLTNRNRSQTEPLRTAADNEWMRM